MGCEEPATEDMRSGLLTLSWGTHTEEVTQQWQLSLEGGIPGAEAAAAGLQGAAWGQARGEADRRPR